MLCSELKRGGGFHIWLCYFFCYCRFIMATIPPSFGDLGKSARDLFEKEFGKEVVLANWQESTYYWMCHQIMSNGGGGK